MGTPGQLAKQERRQSQQEARHRKGNPIKPDPRESDCLEGKQEIALHEKRRRPISAILSSP